VAIIRAIIAMAHILGLEVIAVGVENEGELSSLLSLGCDAIQGHYFCGPVSANRILELFNTDQMVLIPEL
jgi:EAL domain-containing protein (putative c-di-GMP-specific phosphodiesterase class I)